MPSSIALLNIDMQYIHVHPDYAVSSRNASPEEKEYTRNRLREKTLPGIRRLLDAWRARKAPIVHIVFNYVAPDGSDLHPNIFKFDAIKNCPDPNEWPIRRRDDPLSDIIIEVAPLPGETVLEKVTFSAFESTNLENCLINHNVDTIVCVGGQTDCCVKATALGGKKRGYRTICVPEACVTLSDERMQNGLNTANYDQVMTIEDALALL
jgi:nicotinamidase-related amidase